MKAHVYVTLKRTVLDAQGQTVADALRRMEYRGVADVRQWKYFVLTVDDKLGQHVAQTEVERIAREVVTNPGIEEFTFRLEARTGASFWSAEGSFWAKWRLASW